MTLDTQAVRLSLFALFFFACNSQPKQMTITGLMDVYEIDVASKVPGRIVKMLVKEGDPVQAGQKLVLIESHEIEAKLEQVKAATKAAQAKLRLAKKGARDQEKQAVEKALSAAQHQLELAEKMKNRMYNLLQGQAIPQAKYDEVEHKYKMAMEQLAVAQSRASLVKSGARKEEIEALQALVAQGKGALAEVQSYAAETEQHAPITGEVAKVILHPGELAATGYPIVTLVDLKQQWASFVVREDMLKNIHKGDIIQVEVPALGKTIDIEIYHLASLGDFATWRATSEKNSFDLKSFEVRARPQKPIDHLRPGMTVRWTLPN